MPIVLNMKLRADKPILTVKYECYILAVLGQCPEIDTNPQSVIPFVVRFALCHCVLEDVYWATKGDKVLWIWVDF